MRFSLATISMCVLAAAASVLATPHAELDFPISKETLASFNANGYVQILPHFAIVTPHNAFPEKTVKEPDTERPNTIIFKNGYSDCIYWAKIKRSSFRKRIEEITFKKCGSEELLAEVKLDRAMISGEVDKIEIEMPFNRKETITMKRTLISGKYKELKLERSWTKDYVNKVEVPRTFFLGKPKRVETTTKTHA